MDETDEDDRAEVWDARSDALAQVFGSGHDDVLHAPHPFLLGGDAEVVAFHHHLDGAVYVTAELTGKPGASFADYELMICHRSAQDWGPSVISRLAPYTQEAYIDSGESMDIDQATPPDSRIKAFLLTRTRSSRCQLGERASACIGTEGGAGVRRGMGRRLGDSRYGYTRSPTLSAIASRSVQRVPLLMKASSQNGVPIEWCTPPAVRRPAARPRT
jgi:hypothetical protein